MDVRLLYKLKLGHRRKLFTLIPTKSGLLHLQNLPSRASRFEDTFLIEFITKK